MLKASIYDAEVVEDMPTLMCSQLVLHLDNPGRARDCLFLPMTAYCSKLASQFCTYFMGSGYL